MDAHGRPGGHQQRGKAISHQQRGLKSGFSTQCLATKPTAPSCGFGSSLREAGLKTYISPDADRALCRAQGGNNSQGPIYRVPPALGKQSLSTRASSPVLGFGTAKRPGMAVLRNAPGPGAYKLKPTIGGEQIDSTKASATAVHFMGATRDAADKIFISLEHEKAGYGRLSPGMPPLCPSAYNVGTSSAQRPHSSSGTLKGSTRFQNPAAKMLASLPGPGQYTLPAAVGRQPVSTRRTTPAVGFAHADRDASSKIFISADHEKSFYGIGSPGPGTSNPSRWIGRTELSTQPKAPAYGFGTARPASHLNSNPGPGEYYA